MSFIDWMLGDDKDEPYPSAKRRQQTLTNVDRDDDDDDSSGEDTDSKGTRKVGERQAQQQQS